MKNLYVSASVVALSLCSYMAFANEKPTPEQMDAVHECMANAGIEVPQKPVGEPGEEGADSKKKIKMGKLTAEQREVADNCFREAGIEPPTKRVKSSGGEVITAG